MPLTTDLRTLLASVGAALFGLGTLWSVTTGAAVSTVLLWIGLTGLALANATRKRLPARGRIAYVVVGGVGLAALALGVGAPGARMTAAVLVFLGAGTIVDLVLLRLGVSWNQLG